MEKWQELVTVGPVAQDFQQCGSGEDELCLGGRLELVRSGWHVSDPTLRDAIQTCWLHHW